VATIPFRGWLARLVVLAAGATATSSVEESSSSLGTSAMVKAGALAANSDSEPWKLRRKVCESRRRSLDRPRRRVGGALATPLVAPTSRFWPCWDSGSGEGEEETTVAGAEMRLRAGTEADEDSGSECTAAPALLLAAMDVEEASMAEEEGITKTILLELLTIR